MIKTGCGVNDLFGIVIENWEFLLILRWMLIIFGKDDDVVTILMVVLNHAMKRIQPDEPVPPPNTTNPRYEFPKLSTSYLGDALRMFLAKVPVGRRGLVCKPKTPTKKRWDSSVPALFRFPTFQRIVSQK